MGVVGDCAVRMLDEDVVGLVHVAAIATAFVRVVLHFHNPAVASRMNRSAGSHLKIDRVLVGPSVTVSAIVSLRHAVGRAGLKRQSIYIGVIVFGQRAAERVM